MKPKTKGKWSRSLFLPPPLLKRMRNVECQGIPSLFQMLTLKHSQSTHLNVNEYYFQLPCDTLLFFFWLNPSKNTAKFNFSKWLYVLIEIWLKISIIFGMRIGIEISSTGIWFSLVTLLWDRQLSHKPCVTSSLPFTIQQK